MDCATYNENIIKLETLPREQYQLINEASLQNKIVCLHCGEPVKLYLGIQKEPHFLHHKAYRSQNCELVVEQAETKVHEERQYIEQNGFKIPKSRVITTKTSSDNKRWKPTKFAQGILPFKKEPPNSHYSGNEYYVEKLYQSGTRLDSSQLQAATSIEGPLLILAGAGSGKTRVLTARTAYMIQQLQIAPKTIMLVTFTTKAAKEMINRLASYPEMNQHQVRSIVTGTFHSIFFKMLSHHEPERWQSTNLMKWEWQREQIVKEAGRELDLDEKEFAFDQALQQISYWKNTLTPIKDIKAKDQWEDRVLYLCKRYEETKQQRGLFDFDDMLIGCYHLLTENPILLAKYQARFRYFLIDEFQDINKVQYEIMKLLSAQTNNLCVVGDDDQSIYGFRGSDPSFILRFNTDYKNGKVLMLHQNYRSSHEIVSVANKVISNNKHRHTKKMVAQHVNESKPVFFFPYDEEEEATMIVTDLKERIENGAKPADFAILFRTNTASRALFERLSQSNLPFIIDQSSESFYQRRIVRSLLAYLRLSIDPNNQNAMSDLLIALFIKQSVLQDLKATSILEDCSLLTALKSIQNVHSFQKRKLKKIVPLFKKLSKLRPIAAIEMIEKEMGFADFVKKNGNEGNVQERGSDDVRDLKVAARKFYSITDLIDHVDHMIAMNKEMKQLSKQYTDAIQLTTIHRSKGLEYNNVYILSAVDGSLPHDYALDSFRNGDEGALDEECRLMYVAMTRAKESLNISIPETRRGKTAFCSRFIKGLL
mgnify:CR=1 FL=1